MTTIPVALTANGYQIRVERGILSRAGEEIAAVTKARRAALISDSQVGPLYASKVKESLEKAGFTVHTVNFPAGEANKTDATLHMLYDVLLSWGMTRGDAVVALGGGVVGDTAGYAAATLFRGMDCIQIPTSLMAQVDSSVGGKTGVDLPQGKNLLGAFHQPKAVLVDPACLDTLPQREIRGGLAEVVKYGLLADESILDHLEQAQQPDYGFLLPACLSIKARLVVEDERDTGERRLLNFGHTLGHGYEAAGGYTACTHGEAVAAGMVDMLKIEEAQGLIGPELRLRVEALLEKLGLPTHMDCDREALPAALGLDKKNQGKAMHPVYVTAPGKAYVASMSREELLALWEKTR